MILNDHQSSFFKQYRPKNPTQGGAQKLTADALGFGRNQIKVFREKTQELMNLFLEKYAPTKKSNGLWCRN